MKKQLNFQPVYQPIDCNYYDLLEAYATTRRYIRIQYFSDIREFISVDAIIKDLYTRDKMEYMLLNTGEEIPLNQLVSVDGKVVPGCGFDDISCECD